MRNGLLVNNGCAIAPLFRPAFHLISKKHGCLWVFNFLFQFLILDS